MNETPERTWRDVAVYQGQMYGHGISNEMIDAQKEMNGIHDDLVHAMALGMLAYKRPPWYKRFWLWIR